MPVDLLFGRTPELSMHKGYPAEVIVGVREA